MRLTILLCLVLSGCASTALREDRFTTIGETRVKKVEVRSEKQEEAERQAAFYIAQSAVEPPEAAEVATTLSQSLGRPQRPSTDYQAIIKGLEKEIARRDREIKAIIEWHKKYDGMAIAGTGWDMRSPLAIFTILSVVVVLILVPGAMSIAIFVLGRAKVAAEIAAREAMGALKGVVRGVEEFEVDHKEQAEELKRHYIRGTVDARHKELIRQAKANIS